MHLKAFYKYKQTASLEFLIMTSTCRKTPRLYELMATYLYDIMSRGRMKLANSSVEMQTVHDDGTFIMAGLCTCYSVHANIYSIQIPWSFLRLQLFVCSYFVGISCHSFINVTSTARFDLSSGECFLRNCCDTTFTEAARSWPLTHWGRGLESLLKHGCLSAFILCTSMYCPV
jgi:PHP family Zn ribbon phosphoesterase